MKIFQQTIAHAQLKFGIALNCDKFRSIQFVKNSMVIYINDGNGLFQNNLETLSNNTKTGSTLPFSLLGQPL